MCGAVVMPFVAGRSPVFSTKLHINQSIPCDVHVPGPRNIEVAAAPVFGISSGWRERRWMNVVVVLSAAMVL